MAAKEEKTKAGTTPRGKLLLNAQELTFVKALSGNSQELRDRALRRLKKWFLMRSRGTFLFSEEDFMRVWKGLFYSMWMSDKPLVQEELAETISQLVHSFSQPKQSFLFVRCFFLTMGLEWFGLDQLRLNKFLMLVRRFLRQSLVLTGNLSWNHKIIKKLNTALRWSVLSTEVPVPLGLLSHFLEIYLEELAKIGCEQIPPKTVTLLLRPFILFYGRSKEVNVQKLLITFIVDQLIEQHDIAFEYRDKYEAWKKSGYPGNGPEDMEKVEEEEEAADSEGEEEAADSEGEADAPGTNEKVIRDHTMLHGTRVTGVTAALDPRAGNVNVVLPRIPFDPLDVSFMIFNVSKKAKPKKVQRALISQAKKFTMLAKGRYPFTKRYAIKEAKEVADIKQEALDRDGTLWDAVKQLEQLDDELDDDRRKVEIPKTREQRKYEERERARNKKRKLKQSADDETFQKFIDEYAAPSTSKKSRDEDVPAEDQKATRSALRNAKKAKRLLEAFKMDVIANNSKARRKEKRAKLNQARREAAGEDEVSEIGDSGNDSKDLKKAKRVKLPVVSLAAVEGDETLEMEAGTELEVGGKETARASVLAIIKESRTPTKLTEHVSPRKSIVKPMDAWEVSPAPRKSQKSQMALSSDKKRVSGGWEVLPLGTGIGAGEVSSTGEPSPSALNPACVGAWEVVPSPVVVPPKTPRKSQEVFEEPDFVEVDSTTQDTTAVHLTMGDAQNTPKVPTLAQQVKMPTRKPFVPKVARLAKSLSREESDYVSMVSLISEGDSSVMGKSVTDHTVEKSLSPTQQNVTNGEVNKEASINSYSKSPVSSPVSSPAREGDMKNLAALKSVGSSTTAEESSDSELAAGMYHYKNTPPSNRAIVPESDEDDSLHLVLEDSPVGGAPTPESEKPPARNLRPRISRISVQSEKTVATANTVTKKKAEAMDSLSEATEPSSQATEPSSQATEPSSQATELSSDATEPSSEATVPSSEATVPSSEATEPSSEATEPSSEATEPSSEATEPSSEAKSPQSLKPSVERLSLRKRDAETSPGTTSSLQSSSLDKPASNGAKPETQQAKSEDDDDSDDEDFDCTGVDKNIDDSTDEETESEQHEIVLRNNKRVRSTPGFAKLASKNGRPWLETPSATGSPKRSLRLAGKAQPTQQEVSSVKSRLRVRNKLGAAQAQAATDPHSATTATPDSPSNKRVNIVLARNSSYNLREYHRALVTSPGVPYDAERQPRQGVLRNASETSPVNPFYSLKKIMKQLPY